MTRKDDKSMSFQEARQRGKLDEFAEQQKGKADVPDPKTRFERLLEAMASPPTSSPAPTSSAEEERGQASLPVSSSRSRPK